MYVRVDDGVGAVEHVSVQVVVAAETALTNTEERTGVYTTTVEQRGELVSEVFSTGQLRNFLVSKEEAW